MTDESAPETAPCDTVEPDVSNIRERLAFMGVSNVEVHGFAQLDSTNVWLRDHAAGQRKGRRSVHSHSCPPNSLNDERGASSADYCGLCVTDWQSDGAGRRGKPWRARPGNIMFSLLNHSSRPARDLMGLSLVTGIALAECLIQSVGVDVRLKWPNDIMLNDAKLGGLTTELVATPVEGIPVEDTHESGSSEDTHRSTGPEAGGAISDTHKPGNPSTRQHQSGTRILTGVGINLLHDPKVKELGIGAISLQEVDCLLERSDRDLMLADMVSRILAAHQEFDLVGWGGFAARWKPLDWLYGQDVQIHRQNSTEHAVADGVNEQGALLVRRAGKIVPVYSGNVSIRPTV